MNTTESPRVEGSVPVGGKFFARSIFSFLLEYQSGRSDIRQNDLFMENLD